MTTEARRTRWVRAEFKIVDADEGKVPGGYNDQTLGEQTIVLPLIGEHAAVVALDELGQALRGMVDQASRVHPLPVPEPPKEPTEAAPDRQPVAASTTTDVDDIPF
jgi:hypothetical protein